MIWLHISKSKLVLGLFRTFISVRYTHSLSLLSRFLNINFTNTPIYPSTDLSTVSSDYASTKRCTCAHIQTYINTFLYTQLPICIHTNLSTHTRIHTHTYTHTHTHTHKHTHTNTHTHTHTHVHTPIYPTYTHTHTHKRINIQT